MATAPTSEGYRALPGDVRRGGLVILHDAFGITPRIRTLADGFAEDGYEVLAPELDPLPPARAWERVLDDVGAAVGALAPPVFLVGYGWGGAAAWLAACRRPGIAAASIYWGAHIAEMIGEKPLCPTILHFGRRDPAAGVVEAITEAHSEIPAHLYDAGPGFATTGDPSSDAVRLARLRTLQLFAIHGGGRGEL